MLAGASYDFHEKDIQLTHRCNITSIDAPHKPETQLTGSRFQQTCILAATFWQTRRTTSAPETHSGWILETWR